MASPKLVSTNAGLADRVADWRLHGYSVALVPTMGALHAGHLALIEAALRCRDRCIVSIFVNPTQFGPNEDLNRYPSQLEQDRQVVSRFANRLLIYNPAVDQVYPAGFATEVRVPFLARGLCGRSRPHHFAGVATVVARLLMLCRADEAFFGVKDFQQYMIIHRLVKDLAIPTIITPIPIVREADGLALSSRNAYLNDDQRRRAPLLYRYLSEAAVKLAAGSNIATVLRHCRTVLKTQDFHVDYIGLRDAEFSPTSLRQLQAKDVAGGGWRVLVAAEIGSVRLIDNVALEPPPIAVKM